MQVLIVKKIITYTSSHQRSIIVKTNIRIFQAEDYVPVKNITVYLCKPFALFWHIILREKKSNHTPKKFEWVMGNLYVNS